MLCRAGASAVETDDAVAAIVAPLLVDALLLDRPTARTRAHRMVDVQVSTVAR